MDVVHHVFQPQLRVDVVFLAGAEKTVEHGDVPGGIVRTGKKEVLPSQCQRADGVLNQVAVYLQHPVGEIILQADPSVGAILKGFAYGALGGYVALVAIEVGTNLVDDGQRLFQPQKLPVLSHSIDGAIAKQTVKHHHCHSRQSIIVILVGNLKANLTGNI